MMPFPGLRHRRDLQSLVYLVVQPLLAAWQWVFGFSPWLFGVLLVLAVGISVIHHNHAHLPMWRSRTMNRAMDLWLTLVQGHPTFAFLPAHNGNHHRYRHGPRDIARTYRFGGDTNHALGYLLHPLQAIGVVYPMLWAWLRQRPPRLWRWYLAQYGVWLASWAWLLWLDPVRALLFVIGPQLFGLHWLLAANYLQHAHADGHSRWNYARNFTGAINRVWFNIGFHTAHHEYPRAHWSMLPALHRKVESNIDPRLIEASLARYLLQVFVLAPFVPRWRSRSLMSHVAVAAEAHPHVCMPATIEESRESRATR